MGCFSVQYYLGFVLVSEAFWEVQILNMHFSDRRSQNMTNDMKQD